ncbi:endothelial cell-selective adhesion molecule [Protopterus annectens]|uniref:endothelial cell-selective adhesion molecule n=1 Tax=Protopterus annectens TaxID=7888 RepID=UPI001CF9DE82|nr:endothelial cell-selective adhesion molecule [Protopterus annectens]
MEILPLSKLWTLGAVTVGTLLSLARASINIHVGTSPVVVEGQTAVLSAWFESADTKDVMVTWQFESISAEPKQILTYYNGSTSVTPETQFANRIEFTNEVQKKNVSIFIHNTEEQDSGRFTCTINYIPPSSNVGKNIGVVNLTVIVPPGTPKCDIQGSHYVGSNITLTCRSSSGKPVPTFKWERNQEIFFAPTLDSEKGTLTLLNVTTANSGKYICTAMNRAGNATCFANLEVTEAVNVGLIVGAVIGSILGLGLIVLAIFFLFCFQRRKKEAEEGIANEIKEDAQAPKRISWAKSSSPDVISKNGTLSSVNTSRDRKPYYSMATSDTASIMAASGSTVGFNPLYSNANAQALSPAAGQSNHPVAVYSLPQNGNTFNHYMQHEGDSATDANWATSQEAPNHPPFVSGMTPSNLARMGAVPVMVPAQSQAGSLV